MEIKKYYTSNMAEAMERIRRELGPDAVILSDRKVRKKGLKGLFSPRVTEVVVAFEKGEDKLRKIVENQDNDIQQRMDNLRNVLEAVDKRAADTAAQKSSMYRKNNEPLPEKPPRIPPAPSPKAMDEQLTPMEQQRRLEEEIARRVLGGDSEPPAPSPAAAGDLPTSWEPYSPRQVRVNMEAAMQEEKDLQFRRPPGGQPQSGQPQIAPPQIAPPQSPVEPVTAFVPPVVPATSAPPSKAKNAKKSAPEKPEKDLVAEEIKKETQGLSELLRKELDALKRSQVEEIKSLEKRLLEKEKENSKESVVIESMNTRLTGLQNIVETLTERVSTLPTIKPRLYEPNAQAFFDKLVANDVYEDIAHQVIQEAEKIHKDIGGKLEEALELLLIEKMGNVSVPLQGQNGPKTAGRPRVVILFGPTGVGKTTTLVKLAANQAVQENRKVALINADTYRIAAQEQLRTYADIISVPTRVVYSPDEIKEAMKEFADMDMIFIDTAGKKPTDQVHKDEIARLISITGAAEQLLVLSAPSSYQTLRQIIDNYSFLKDFKLLITKTDEVKGMGAVLSSAVYAARPLSYITCGQNVPDDIEQADIPAIAQALLT